MNEVAAMREEAALAVDRTSLRRVAAEIGISPTGLGKFLKGGGTLYGPSRRRFARWMEARQPLAAPDAALVDAALTILVRELPDDVREQVLKEAVEILVAAYSQFTVGAKAVVQLRRPRTPPAPPVRPPSARQAVPAPPPPPDHREPVFPRARLTLIVLPAGRALSAPAGAVIWATGRPIIRA
jgi:hypothetical protein